MAGNINLQQGDCLDLLKMTPPESVDLIFADPPYNLSGPTSLTCSGGRPVACDKGKWDQIADIDQFNLEWIRLCKNALKPEGTLWISGTLHNHPSVGQALKQLRFWIINDIIWYKPNATPLLQRNRLAPSTELIWLAAKSKHYYFDYVAAKEINGGKQMRNLWTIPAQRHKTTHPTEKPETLLERIIQLGSRPGDIVLDPFMGSGTTGVVAARLGRAFVGFELDPEYYRMAVSRIAASSDGSVVFTTDKMKLSVDKKLSASRPTPPVLVVSDPATQDIVYRTVSSSKYHRSECSYMKNRLGGGYLKNGSIPLTRSEAITLGLTPCNVCNP